MPVPFWAILFQSKSISVYKENNVSRFLIGRVFYTCGNIFNPFTPKSDQFQISPAASPEIYLHHTVWRTWLFIVYDEVIILPILTTSLIHFSMKRLGECTFWTWQWKVRSISASCSSVFDDVVCSQREHIHRRNETSSYHPQVVPS